MKLEKTMMTKARLVEATNAQLVEMDDGYAVPPYQSCIYPPPSPALDRITPHPAPVFQTVSLDHFRVHKLGFATFTTFPYTIYFLT